MTMLGKLAAIEERYEEINQLLADPEVSADYTKIHTLAKEQAGLRTLVQLSIEYKDISRQLEDVRAINLERPNIPLIDSRWSGQRPSLLGDVGGIITLAEQPARRD